MTVCNWVSNAELYKASSRKLANTIIYEQFQTLIALTTHKTIEFYKQYLLVYIKKDLFIEPSQQVNRRANRDDYFRYRREDELLRSINDFRIMIGYNGRIIDLDSEADNELHAWRRFSTGIELLRTRSDHRREE